MKNEDLEVIVSNAEKYDYKLSYPHKYGYIYITDVNCLKLNKSLRGNKDFMLNLIKENANNFLISSRKLKNDFDFVSQSIALFPKGFSVISKNMQSNFQIAQSAIEKYWPNYLILPNSLLKNKQLFLIALKHANKEGDFFSINLLINKHKEGITDNSYFPKSNGSINNRSKEYYENIIFLVEKAIERDNLNIELKSLGTTNKVLKAKQKI